jgi:hypothetical protein
LTTTSISPTASCYTAFGATIAKALRQEENQHPGYDVPASTISCTVGRIATISAQMMAARLLVGYSKQKYGMQKNTLLKDLIKGQSVFFVFLSMLVLLLGGEL